MEAFLIIGGILLIHIFAWMTPGPLSILIIQNSLAYGKKTGLGTALGIACGNFIHISYSIGAILLAKKLPDIFMHVIGFLGILYLLYIGIKIFLSTSSSKKIQNLKQIKELPLIKAFKIGFTINILSPQASLFFASIIASVSTGNNSFIIMLTLLFILPINSFIMAYLMSIFFTQKRIRIKYLEHQNIINKILGSILIGFAVLLIINIMYI